MADGDFPAAHSMDVVWFAVDKCGHVASFDTGDEGALPFEASEVADFFSTSLPLPTELKRALQEDKLRIGRHETKLDSSVIHTDDLAGQRIRTSYDSGWGFFLVGPGALSAREMIRPPVTKDPSKCSFHPPEWGSTDGFDWLDGSMHPDSWRWLHAAPDRCLGCGTSVHFFDDREKMLRIFEYHTHGYDGPPYEREFAPEKPATLEELQAWFPEPLPKPVRFSEFCFRDKPLIQPLQYFESSRWAPESDWVHEDGRRLRHDGAPVMWLAVDRCNHLAVFESGQDGAVPEGAPHGAAVAFDLRPVAGELDRCLQEERIVPGAHESTTPDNNPNLVRGFYLLGPGLKDQLTGTPEDLFNRWKGTPEFGTTDGHDWAQGLLDGVSWDRLHEVPKGCLGCVTYLSFDFNKRAETHRIIRYECSQSGAVPYERAANHPVPATLEEVSKAFGRRLPKAPRFSDFCFLDKPRLQPLQWLTCAPREGREEFVDEEGRPRKIQKPEP